MTINLGLVYDKGVLLLADRQVNLGFRKYSEDMCKIFKIYDNISLAITGSASSVNEVNDLIYAAQIGSAHFDKLAKRKKQLKPLLKMADIQVTEATELKDKIKDKSLTNILQSWEGEDVIPKKVFRIYRHNGQNLFDAKSVARQFNYFLKENAHGIVAGVDIKGSRIIKVLGGFMCELPWAAHGVGSPTIETNMKNHYEEISGFEQALGLAIFCGVRSEKDFDAINKDFMVVNITKQNNKVVSKLVQSELVKEITRFYDNKKGSFEHFR